MNRLRKISLVILVLFSTNGWANALGTIIRNSDLKSSPVIDASVVGAVQENAQVTILGYEGAWSKVQTQDGKIGWIRMLNIKPGKQEDAPSVRGVVSQVGGVVRTGTTKMAATTGVKGLSKEEIKNSKPNLVEIRKLEAFKAKPKDVENFAAKRQLRPQEIPES